MALRVVNTALHEWLLGTRGRVRHMWRAQTKTSYLLYIFRTLLIYTAPLWLGPRQGHAVGQQRNSTKHT